MNEKAGTIPEQAVEVEERHYLSAVLLRLKTLYDLTKESNVREQISDEVDWIESRLSAVPLVGVEREWVSVKDRLPDLDQVVLVHYPGFDGTPTYNWGARVDGGEGWCWGVKGGYGGSVHLGKDASYNDIEVDDDYPVTHWKPLDPPPTLLAEKSEVKS